MEDKQTTFNTETLEKMNDEGVVIENVSNEN